jgi:hypothetical protein
LEPVLAFLDCAPELAVLLPRLVSLCYLFPSVYHERLCTSGGSEQTAGTLSATDQSEEGDGGVSCLRSIRSFLIGALWARQAYLRLRRRPF